MSDQPKPTGDAFAPDTDSFVPEADQRELAKPTGKWTMEWLRQYLAGYSSYDLQLKAIADAHNAAISAEREKMQTYEGALINIANDPNCDRCQVAVDALAKVGK